MNDITTNQTTYSTAFDLFQQWCNDGYPDYVTGIWSTDGSYYNVTIGITNDAAGEAGKQEILDLVENDATVTFSTQAYTHNYLMQIQDELLPYFKEDLGLVASGLYDKENYIGVEILSAKAKDKATLNFIAELKEKYGDAVSVSYAEGYATTTDEIGLSTPLSSSNGGKTSSSLLLAAGLIGILLLIFGTYFALRKRFVPVLQTNAGGTVTQTGKLSAKEVEGIVKDRSLTVSKDVDKRVMTEIQKTGK